MAGKNTAAFGIYANREMAENAVDRLIAQGFRNEDISVMLQDNVGTKDFAHEKNTKAPEGTATGAATGATVGGTLGLLAGIGALAIPGLGPFIAAGPIMATLAGIGSGGLVGGSSARWSAWAYPSTKRKATKAGLKKAEFFSRFIAITVTGLEKQNIC